MSKTKPINKGEPISEKLSITEREFILINPLIDPKIAAGIGLRSGDQS